jgi:hypothetical protein
MPEVKHDSIWTIWIKYAFEFLYGDLTLHGRPSLFLMDVGLYISVCLFCPCNFNKIFCLCKIWKHRLTCHSLESFWMYGVYSRATDELTWTFLVVVYTRSKTWFNLVGCALNVNRWIKEEFICGTWINPIHSKWF